jgi:hypothetical protein
MDKSKYCKIGWNGEFLILLTNDNQPIPAQTKITITDEIEEIPTAKVELFINLDEIIDLRTKEPKKVIKDSLLKRFVKYLSK